MKLDPRIKDISKILLRNEMDKAKKYVGTKCYFGNDLVDFIDIDNECFLGTLTNVDELDDIEPYEGKIERVDVEPYFSYLLPAEFIEKEKPKKEKYVPFETLNDLSDYKIHLGGVIQLRPLDAPDIQHSTIVTNISFECNSGEIILITLGADTYSLDTLCNNYLIKLDNKWVPFGKKVKE